MLSFPFQIDRAIALVFEPRYAFWPDLQASFLEHGIGNLEMRCSRVVDEDGQLPPKMADTTTWGSWRTNPNGYSFWRKQAVVFQEAIDAGVENLLHVEDDCILDKSFGDVCSSAHEQLGTRNFDMVYFGHHMGRGSRRTGIAENLASAERVSGFQCVLLRNSLLRKLLEIGPVGPMDDTVGRLIPGIRAYAVLPPVAHQKSGWSFIEQKNVRTVQMDNACRRK